jgi:hypothetical protein
MIVLTGAASVVVVAVASCVGGSGSQSFLFSSLPPQEIKKNVDGCSIKHEKKFDCFIDFDFSINNDKGRTGVTRAERNINLVFKLIGPENFIEAGVHSILSQHIHHYIQFVFLSPGLLFSFVPVFGNPNFP